MTAFRIIPAIDILGGRCVRLVKGAFDSATTYSDSPLEVALQFEAAGVQYLHLVDLDGARNGAPVHLHILEQLAAHTKLHIDFGGGLRTRTDVQRAFDAGAAQITAGSIAAGNPDEVKDWLHTFGGSRILLGLDVKDGRIATSGWQAASHLSVKEYLDSYTAAGAKYVVSTVVERDGTLQGPDVAWYRHLAKACPHLQCIASGGVSHVDDLHALREAGAAGAIVGKALYEGRITLKQIADLC